MRVDKVANGTKRSVSNPAHLVLEDGSVYRGEAFGAARSAHGEVVFSTSMTRY